MWTCFWLRKYSSHHFIAYGRNFPVFLHVSFQSLSIGFIIGLGWEKIEMHEVCSYQLNSWNVCTNPLNMQYYDNSGLKTHTELFRYECILRLLHTSSSKYYSCNFVLFRICWVFDVFFPSPSTTQNHDTFKMHNFAFDHIIYASPWVFILANEQAETCLLIWILFILQWKIFR